MYSKEIIRICKHGPVKMATVMGLSLWPCGKLLLLMLNVRKMTEGVRERNNNGKLQVSDGI